jgi:hypothetical protein
MRRAAAVALARVSDLIAGLRGFPRATPSPRPGVDPPLDDINDRFHASYDRARNAASRDGPVFIVLADELIIFRNDEREALSFSPRSFHVIKSAAHAPVALYAMFAGPAPVLETQLAAMRGRIVAALESEAMAWDELSDARSDLNLVLQRCCEFLDETGSERACEARLRSFAAEMGPPLLRLAQEATRLQLLALHEHTERAVRGLSAEQRGRLKVVVAGDHQARVRSLAMQYFRKRLAEPSGAEKRVTYAEGVRDERSALALVGTQRLDRAIAQAFFGEESRLQRDILGDAAESQLRSFAVTTI